MYKNKNILLDRLIMFMVTNYQFPKVEAENFVVSRYEVTRSIADVEEEVYNYCCDYD